MLTGRWLQAKEWWSQTCVGTKTGCLLLGLVAISLTTMPITQHLWTWDGFLHGGQDFETGAFLILSTFCLVLVLARSCKAILECLLTRLRILGVIPRARQRATFRLSGGVIALLHWLAIGSRFSAISVPLQI
jgi:hypothetical protein